MLIACVSATEEIFYVAGAILLFPDQKIISCAKEYDRMPSELVGKLSSCLGNEYNMLAKGGE